MWTVRHALLSTQARVNLWRPARSERLAYHHGPAVRGRSDRDVLYYESVTNVYTHAGLVTSYLRTSSLSALPPPNSSRKRKAGRSDFIRSTGGLREGPRRVLKLDGTL
jgi:hypothetical protein